MAITLYTFAQTPGLHLLEKTPDSRMVFVHRVDTENEYHYDPDDIYKMIGLVLNSKIE